MPAAHTTLTYQSSYRRTKQRLRVKPDASFIPSLSEKFDHVIYSPAPSAPSVYHTPTKFLPPNDIRRRLRSAREEKTINAQQLPVVQKIKVKPKILTADEIAQIKTLRFSDPIYWSQAKLAKKFGCSPIFVGQICEASPEKKELQKNLLEAIKSSWGIKRTLAREDRELRRERWMKDA
ncbi:hypothetical protein KEM54_005339 [Ascosphaera aggregata]|nr:hypothetical protein KEM54_005339 [Ascosphaera aggregata]